MRPLYLFVIGVLLFKTCGFSAEGGPAWWWDCKQSDLIIRGTIQYDTNKHYRIIPPAGSNIGEDHYYVVGSIKIDEVIHANLSSQYKDNYRHYMGSIGQRVDILIPMNAAHYTHMRREELILSPKMRGALLPDSSIFSFDVIYIFPIGGLVLKSSVPIDSEPEALRLIAERKPIKKK